ncbi:hypothetical protein ERN12_02835 [Rhodobacteraceae bacterium]|nr:hypothetical protein ERN12_02835 [Paracoccaceae bacterium]
MTAVYEGKALGGIFAGMVAEMGGYYATVTWVKETTGRSMSEGTITKIVSGDMKFDFALAFMIEDQIGRHPVSALIGSRCKTNTATVELQHAMKGWLKESSEVAPAAFEMLTSGDTTACEKELVEDIAAAQAFLAALRRKRDEEGAR